MAQLSVPITDLKEQPLGFLKTDEFNQMAEDFLRENGVKDVLRIPLGGSICTNTGPNIVGIVYLGEKRA